MRRILTSYESRSASNAAFTLLAGLFSGLLLTGLTGCADWAHHEAAPDPYRVGPLPAADLVAKAKVPGHWVKDGDDRLRFTGQIAPGAAAELTTLLAGAPKTTTVVATVPGGDLAEGLAIGRTLHDHKLALEIEGPCVGPCADYWFPAATTRKAASGSWLGYVPDLAETTGATTEARAAEAKLYADSGVDGTKFRAALDTQLRESPNASSPPPVGYWMPDKADLVGLGYPATSLTGVWLPPNLTSANAHAHAWGDIVAYKNTLVGVPAAPAAPAAPAPAAPAPPAPAPAAGN